MGFPIAAHGLRRVRPVRLLGGVVEGVVDPGDPTPPPPPPPPPPDLPQVRPVSAQFISEHYGISTQPSFQSSIYKEANQPTWMGYVADTRARYIRGVYAAGNAGSIAAADKCRELGIGFLMLIIPESTSGPTDQSVAATRATVQHIAANYPDVCVGIEGLNEPNHNRDDGNPDTPPVPVPANWATTTMAHQNAIWQEVQAAPSLKGKVSVLGPSLHDTAAYDSYTKASPSGGAQHWHQLAAAGLAVGVNMDWLGIHRYSGGYPPTQNLGSRLNYIKDAFGATCPVWITETGYHNALNAPPPVHLPVNEATSGTYGPRAILEIVAKRRIAVTRYELLDDVDAGRDHHESNFGMYAVGALGEAGTTSPSTWRAKPEAVKVRALMEQLYDPGPAYSPAVIGVKVEAGSADVQNVVVARRDGSARIFLWRSASVWDPKTEATIPAGYTKYTTVVTDRLGSHPPVEVGADVVSVDLR